MSDKKRILIVDDSPNEIRILMELLKDDYAVVAATSGEKALEAISGENTPDLVLMDVTMDPMDGYEACEKSLALRPELPIIFVSANTRTEEILKGFEVGGSDYITKPIDPEVVSTKVKLTLEQTEQRQALEEEKSQATELVMTALTNAGNLSIVLSFLREGLKVKTRDELANNLIEALKKYNLDGSLEMRSSASNICRSTSENITPLELELLSRSANMDTRLVEKGSRLIINFDSVSMLIKNMPIEDEIKCGEIRDYLMILAEDAFLLNTKVDSDESISQQRNALVGEMLQETQQTLQKVEESQKEQKESSMKIMDSLASEIEENFLSMGLTEEQEILILDIIQSKIQEALDNFEHGLKMDEQLKRISSQLGELSGSF